MEIAQAQIQQQGKGEDAYLVRRLDRKGTAHLIAVADGLSLTGGRAAARWAINHLRKVPDVENPRSICSALKRALAESQQTQPSETTLTCGVLRQLDYENEPFLRFEFFAIGDSPIWKVIPGDSKYPFQRQIVHGPLYPTETARVYSTLRLDKRDITGSIMFGTTEIAVGEVLVVCTDGIPEREVFIRDFAGTSDTDLHKSGLCHWLFQERKYSDSKLKGVLKAYHERGILFDDATIIAARLGPARIAVKNVRPQTPDSLMEQSFVETQPTNDADERTSDDQVPQAVSESSPPASVQAIGNAYTPEDSEFVSNTLEECTPVQIRDESGNGAITSEQSDSATETRGAVSVPHLEDET
jgi:serine/threonine protein phosphatase PrpC